MDNAQKAIMIGVGLFITIIIISAVLLIVNLGTGLVDDATAELGSMSTSLQNQILQNYDGKKVSGTQVKAAFQQYAGDSSLCVVLISAPDASSTYTASSFYEDNVPLLAGTANTTGSSAEIVASTGAKAITKLTGKIGETGVTATSTEILNFGTGTGAAGYSQTANSKITDSLSPQYINTSKTYNASVIRDDVNDTIIGIAFQLVK